jgi:hypothetical protein
MKTLKRSYNLKKFNSSQKINISNTIKITSNIEIFENLINLSFSILGDISKIIIPNTEFTKDYKRKDDLWKTTCFELFLASKTSKSYSEINVSSSYEYNIYSFTDYRKNMQLENNLSIKNIKKDISSNLLNLTFSIESKNKINIEDLIINITSVVESTNNEIEYWAINHLEDKADFHNLVNFVDF